jgi:hypothetical protein
MSSLEIKEPKEILVGEVIEYKASTHQALVELNHEHGLCAGDTIRVRGTPEWDQRVERMSKNGKPAAKAFPGESVWIVFLNPGKKGDKVFLLVWEISPPTPGHPGPSDPPPDDDKPDLPDHDNFPVGNGGKRRKSKGKGPGSGG